jgi:hypothetical protein
MGSFIDSPHYHFEIMFFMKEAQVSGFFTCRYSFSGITGMACRQSNSGYTVFGGQSPEDPGP